MHLAMWLRVIQYLMPNSILRFHFPSLCVLLAATAMLPVGHAVSEEVPIARAVGSQGDLAAEFLALKFLAAKTAEEVLPMIVDGEKNAEAVKAFFATYKVPAEPVVKLIQSDGGKKSGDSIFNVSASEWTDPVAILVTKSGDGPRVDWGLFEEFYTQALLKFLENEEPSTGTFRVLMKRIHYFESDVPELDKKECFQTAALSTHWAGNVFVPKSSDLMTKLNKQVAWGTVTSAVVTLKSHKAPEGMWVEVVSVPSFFWTTTQR